jgi:hypothetical protein
MKEMRYVSWTVVGILAVALGPILISVFTVDNAPATYVLGFVISAAISEGMRKEASRRRRENDRIAHDSLQRWYKRKHGGNDMLGFDLVGESEHGDPAYAPRAGCICPDVHLPKGVID